MGYESRYVDQFDKKVKVLRLPKSFIKKSKMLGKNKGKRAFIFNRIIFNCAKISVIFTVLNKSPILVRQKE